MNIGIYCLYFDKLDDMYYIGCSSNLSKRKAWHISMLSLGKHTNKRLQQAFIEYGTPVVEVLELCTLDKLKDREIFWIKEFSSFTRGFNNTSGGDGAGFGEGVHNALYTESVYKEILRTLATTTLSLREVAIKLNVKLDVVKHISSLSGHTWLEESMPNEYNIVKNKYLNNSRNNSAGSKGIIYPILVSPSNVKFIVSNIHEFCREHSLQPQNLHKVLTGQRKNHKGWFIEKNNESNLNIYRQ